MRVLIVQESSWSERGPHQQHHIADRLLKRNHEIKVIDYDIDWKKKRNKLFIGRTESLVEGKAIPSVSVEVIRPAMLGAPILSYLSSLITSTIEIIRQMKSFRPDFVVGLGILNAFIATVICRLFRRPFIYYLIDSLHTLIPESHFRSIGRRIEQQAIKKSSVVLVINNHLAKYAKNMGAKKNIEIVSAGVDKTIFQESGKDKSIRQKFGIRDNEIVLFFMGWLYEFSGLKEVARSLIENKDNNIRLLILGKGDLYDELKLLEKKSDGKIIIQEWVPYEMVPRYLQAADFCILPAYNNQVMRDIVPIKLYEYLACGRPVISTLLPGIFAEFGSENGVIYIRKSDETITKAANTFSNQAKYLELCESALRYTQDLGWDNIVDRFECILRELKSR